MFLGAAMSIICLEGASAVGKTSVCNLLEQKFGYIRIGEVNELFQRSTNEAKTWYFERQIDRWKRASEISSQGGVALLDGDPFEPLWYNWIYSSQGLKPLDEVFNFYQSQIVAGKIGFPDKYIILTASKIELRKRKELDLARSRRNFDKHLKFVEPQIAYFEAMRNNASNIVEFIVSDNIQNVATRIFHLDKYSNEDNSFELLKEMFEFVVKRTIRQLNRTNNSWLCSCLTNYSQLTFAVYCGVGMTPHVNLNHKNLCFFSSHNYSFTIK